GCPRFVMRMRSPLATRSSSSGRCVLASKEPTEVISFLQQAGPYNQSTRLPKDRARFHFWGSYDCGDGAVRDHPATGLPARWGRGVGAESDADRREQFQRGPPPDRPRPRPPVIGGANWIASSGAVTNMTLPTSAATNPAIAARMRAAARASVPFWKVADTSV